jgi:hypothetical protein
MFLVSISFCVEILPPWSLATYEVAVEWDGWRDDMWVTDSFKPQTLAGNLVELVSESVTLSTGKSISSHYYYTIYVTYVWYY